MMTADSIFSMKFNSTVQELIGESFLIARLDVIADYFDLLLSIRPTLKNESCRIRIGSTVYFTL